MYHMQYSWGRTSRIIWLLSPYLHTITLCRHTVTLYNCANDTQSHFNRWRQQNWKVHTWNWKKHGIVEDGVQVLIGGTCGLCVFMDLLVLLVLNPSPHFYAHLRFRISSPVFLSLFTQIFGRRGYDVLGLTRPNRPSLIFTYLALCTMRPIPTSVLEIWFSDTVPEGWDTPLICFNLWSVLC